jgi:hypothetical protein
MEVIVKRDIIVAVLLVLSPTISACALSDPQDRVKTAAAGLSRGSSQVPDPESILSEETKKMNVRVRQCTNAAVAAFESAQDTAALRSQYASGEAKCTTVDVDIDDVMERAMKHIPDGLSGAQRMKFEEDRKLPYQQFNENRKALAEKFSQNIQPAFESAKTQLTAAYIKRLPKLAAGDATEASRKADETRASERTRPKAVEAKKVTAADERRTVVYKFIAKERFSKLDALLRHDALIASKNASAKIGFNEWTIGTSRRPSMTQCMSVLQGVVPEIFQDEVSPAQAAAREALEPLFDSSQICVGKSTAFKAPVDVVLIYEKGKLTQGRYHLNPARKNVLINTLNRKYGKPATSEKKVRTKDDIMKEMRKDAKAACGELKKGKKRAGAGMVAMFGDFNCDLGDTSPMVRASIGIPTAGSIVGTYIWKVGATETKVEYADFWRTSSGEWKPFLLVNFDASNDVGDQLAAETKKLTNDIVKAYNTVLEASVNKKRSKDF